MEKLLFEYLCQLERVLPTVRAQEVVDTNTFRAECWEDVLLWCQKGKKRVPQFQKSK